MLELRGRAAGGGGLLPSLRQEPGGAPGGASAAALEKGPAGRAGGAGAGGGGTCLGTAQTRPAAALRGGGGTRLPGRRAYLPAAADLRHHRGCGAAAPGAGLRRGGRRGILRLPLPAARLRGRERRRRDGGVPSVGGGLHPGDHSRGGGQGHVVLPAGPPGELPLRRPDGGHPLRQRLRHQSRPLDASDEKWRHHRPGTRRPRGAPAPGQLLL